MSDDSELSEAAESGSEIAAEGSEMSSILGDAYRGELDRETRWRSRLDQTTTRGVTVVAAILTWTFSSADNPHYIILVGVLAVSLFSFIEARRYRDYDVYRSRVRLFQQNLFADALDWIQREILASRLEREKRGMAIRSRFTTGFGLENARTAGSYYRTPIIAGKIPIRRVE